MDFSSSFIKMNCRSPPMISRITSNKPASFAFTEKHPGFLIQRTDLFGEKLSSRWKFVGGSRVILQLNHQRSTVAPRKSSGVFASLPSSEIASSIFTLGTAAVLPFYTFMIVAPKAKLTQKVMESSIPYIVLGLVYTYLLRLSWTPDTIRLMFASEFWLPELPGIAKMFSNEVTLASAWIHLLAVDLFAARQVYRDGLQNDIETRHSVCLCLLFCPVGIVSHFVTKAITNNLEKGQHRIH